MLNSFYRMQAGKKKKKQIVVGALKLGDKDGLLKQTFGKNHHSWWRSHEFDVDAVTIQVVEI